MSIRHLAAAAVLLAVPAGLSAQGFEGAEISAELLGFTDDFSLGEKEYRGAFEFSLFGGFGVAADLGYHSSREIGLGGRNATLHGLYDRLGTTTAGVFYGRDSDDDDGSTSLYGIEAAADLMGAEIEGALGRYDGDEGDGAMLSADLRYGFGNFAGTAFAGGLSGDLEGSRLALGGEYQLMAGPTLYAELGRRSLEDEADTYVALGARLAIGPKGGTTFDSRSLWEILPGR
ncbi:hypothetical protein [Rubellimicrobium roseum]|uniref:Porin n=1 Tax=Rubellimicrobium roseum TaxID=687525 RepID=A0A5C4NCC2_9RHOB|nr:hypothetical protein [Rubellimicrobium roseum]TNC69480.1 hypothetical protein FHG71_13790 [Rubellimicrobium roseum]